METADLKQEFRDLLRGSGWSQAEAARQLAMTPSALSQIVRANSPVRPSPVTLRLFRLLLMRGKPRNLAEPAPHPKAPRKEAWEREFVRALRRVPAKTRHSILTTLRAMIVAAQPPGRGNQSSRRPGHR